MRFAIVGYGKMGKVIEKIAKDRGHEIVAIIDKENVQELRGLNKETVDVAIEFSAPKAAYENLKTCISNGLSVVSGTTGWLEHKQEIENLTEQHNAAFFYASNYSIGVNLFFQLNKHLAALMKPHSQYQIHTTEIHHTEKLDAPSGTAITLAEGILQHREDKNCWVSQAIPKANEVPVWSTREGKVPGTHSIKYISEVDEIEIKHEAKSRFGFALGAVIAAEWMKDKEGIFGMEDMLGFQV